MNSIRNILIHWLQVHRPDLLSEGDEMVEGLSLLIQTIADVVAEQALEDCHHDMRLLLAQERRRWLERTGGSNN